MPPDEILEERDGVKYLYFEKYTGKDVFNLFTEKEQWTIKNKYKE